MERQRGEEQPGERKPHAAQHGGHGGELLPAL